MKTLLILFFSMLTGASIVSHATNSQSSQITEIRFGTSFGTCSGYCIQEVVFKADQIEKTLIPHRDKSLKVKQCIKEFTAFDSLVSKIDLNSFDQLEVTIGCPDCSDDGAEWVQIFTSDGFHKKVTYSFSKEPHAIKPYINMLRTNFDSLGECSK